MSKMLTTDVLQRSNTSMTACSRGVSGPAGATAGVTSATVRACAAGGDTRPAAAVAAAPPAAAVPVVAEAVSRAAAELQMCCRVPRRVAAVWGVSQRLLLLLPLSVSLVLLLLLLLVLLLVVVAA
jgi:hypothetical protein